MSSVADIAEPARFERELAVAVEAARQAGASLLRHFTRGVDAEWKGDRDPVTIADRDAEDIVRAVLSAAFPGDEIVGEEGEAASELAVAGRRRWYVDPLDGTSNFLKGWERWSVSIAFCDADDVMSVGVVAHPMIEETFTATRAMGAFRSGVPIRVSNVTALDEALLVTGTNPMGLADIARLWPAVLTGRVTGSTALDLCDVAQGRADVHISSNQGRWDLAAGTLIAREAGAAVLGPDLEPSVGPLDGCVVAAPQLLDDLWAYLHPQRMT